MRVGVRPCRIAAHPSVPRALHDPMLGEQAPAGIPDLDRCACGQGAFEDLLGDDPSIGDDVAVRREGKRGDRRESQGRGVTDPVHPSDSKPRELTK